MRDGTGRACRKRLLLRSLTFSARPGSAGSRPDACGSAPCAAFRRPASRLAPPRRDGMAGSSWRIMPLVKSRGRSLTSQHSLRPGVAGDRPACLPAARRSPVPDRRSVCHAESHPRVAFRLLTKPQSLGTILLATLRQCSLSRDVLRGELVADAVLRDVASVLPCD